MLQYLGKWKHWAFFITFEDGASVRFSEMHLDIFVVP